MRFRCTCCREEYDDHEEAYECASGHTRGGGFTKVTPVPDKARLDTEWTKLSDYEGDN